MTYILAFVLSVVGGWFLAASDALFRAEDRPGTRDEDDPEARAEEEAAADVSCTPAREEQERALEQLAGPRDDER